MNRFTTLKGFTQEQVDMYVKPYLDRAVDFLINSDLYVSDIDFLKMHLPKVELAKKSQKADGTYTRASKTIKLKMHIIYKMRSELQSKSEYKNQRLSTYYLNKIDRYIDHKLVTIDTFLMTLMIHELTHHIQNLRRINNLYGVDFIHTVDMFNTDRLDLRSIKSYECETTYNELEYVERHVDNSESIIQSISSDKKIVDNIFEEDNKLPIYKYSMSSRYKPSRSRHISELSIYYKDQLKDLSNGIVPRRTGLGDENQICLLQKRNGSKSCMLYVPKYELTIDSIFYRHRKINMQLYRLAEKNGILVENEYSIASRIPKTKRVS